MKLLLFLIFTSFVYCDAYNMFWSICKAVFTTIITDFQSISVNTIRRINPINSSTDVSLIIFKGSQIDAYNYLGISKTIQRIGAKKGLNIDIKIPHYPYYIHSKHNTVVPTFILGHSSGVYDFLSWHNASKYNGLIQIGSVLNSNAQLPWKSRKLETFPIPVLTIVGEKDGYLRHTYCLGELYKQNEIEKYQTKPIIIMKDITHLQISNTSSSSIANFIGLYDIESSLNINKAWHMLALCIVDFIILNINDIPANNSMQRMQILQKKTQQLLSYYLKFDNIQKLKSLLDIIYFFLNKYKQCDISYLNYYDFLIAKPTDTTMYFYKEKRNIFSKMYFTPLWVKTKYIVHIPAKEFNKHLFKLIANNMKSSLKYKIVFENDKICSTSLEWILSPVIIEKINDVVYIKSPVFITTETTIIYKNFYYFKILSPSQIIELINTDLK